MSITEHTGLKKATPSPPLRAPELQRALNPPQESSVEALELESPKGPILARSDVPTTDSGALPAATVDSTPKDKRKDADYIQGADFVPRNSLRGVWYIIKCWIASLLPWEWEPKEPHDKHYRTFIKLVEELKELMKDRKRMLSILGSKGGVGKTPLATYLAALLAYVTHRRIVIVDANHNEGTTGETLGISRDRRTLLLAAIKNPAVLDSSDQTREGLGFHDESGLWALLSNPNSITENVTMKEFITLLFYLLWRFDAVISDGGNGIAHPTQNGAAHVGDVLLIPALDTKRSSFGIGMTTMLGYLDLGHTDKVRASLKIVSATNRKSTRKEYVDRYRDLIYKFASNEFDPRGDDNEVQVKNKWFNRGDDLMEALGISEENFFLVPANKHIADERIVTLKRQYIGMPALIAYMRILVRVYQMNVPDEDEKRNAINALYKTSEQTDDDAITSAPSTSDIDQAARNLIKLAGNKDAAGVAVFHAIDNRES